MKANGSALQKVGSTVLAPILWGTTYVTVTELLPEDRPFLVAAGRVVPAGILLAAYGVTRSGWHPRRADWPRLALLSLFNFAIFFPLLIVAAYRLPGGVAASAGGLQPLLVTALTWLLAGTRPRPLDIVVGVLAAAGVTLVVVGPGAGFDAIGIAAAVGANVSFAVGVVLTKRFPAPGDRIGATGWQLLASGAVLVPLALIAEGPPPALTASHAIGFAYLSLAATGLAFVLWFSGIARLPAIAPPLLGLAAPLTGATAGWILLAQALSPLQLAGFAVTLGAIAYGASRPQPADPRELRSPSRHRGLDHHPTPQPPESTRAGCSPSRRPTQHDLVHGSGASHDSRPRSSA